MRQSKYKIAFLCGKGGGDLIAINTAIKEKLLVDVEISCVLVPCGSVLPDNIELKGLPFKTYSIKKETKKSDIEGLYSILQHKDLDMIFLAGFEYILPGYFVDGLCPMVNSHHSLLPAFPGLFVKEDIVKTDVGILGHTLHYVDHGVDTGIKIIQMAMPNLSMQKFDQILALYRLGADIMNLNTLLKLSSEKSNKPMNGSSYIYDLLLFSEKLDSRVIEFIKSRNADKHI